MTYYFYTCEIISNITHDNFFAKYLPNSNDDLKTRYNDILH